MCRLLIFVTILGFVCGHVDENVEGGKCERIRLPLCQDMAYNWTSMPNLLGHNDQKEAEEAMSAFADVLDGGCSSLARFLLCSAFAPLCSEKVTGVVSACRGLCETVLEDCRHSLREFVPAMRLDCSAFQPEATSSRLCMRPPDDQLEHAPPPSWPAPQPARDPACLGDAGGADCRPACGADVAFDAAAKRRAELWIGTLAGAALTAVAAALLTFCADPGRYRYPARPAVWAAACHGVVALAYAARSVLGARAVSCAGGTLAADGLAAPACVAFFVVTHYFTLAADAWIAGAGAAWYLTAAGEWSTEALERAGAHVHAAAWGWAGAWTAAALALRRVSADELTGTCGVAGAAAGALLAVPRGAPLLVGAVLALAARPGLARVRRALGSAGAARVGRVAARAGLAGSLYAVCAGAATAARVLEARAEPSAGAAWSCCLCLASGVASASWAWSRKSPRVWRRALCPPRKPPPATTSVPTVAPLLPLHKRPLPVSIV